MRRTIQIEFNELSPTLIDEFIDAGELPNFRKLRDSSEVFVTDAANEINLEPWVQWPTLHTGIPDRDHGIQHLGEADLVAGRGIARELAAAGFKVGVFGSMNLDYGPLDGFVIPDPWNAELSPHPADIKAFTTFVVSAVQENSADQLDKRAALPFARYLATHGLTPATALSTVQQLLGERRDPGVKWRRSFALDAMSYDVFRNLVRRHNVAFATFFSNSTAHLQHYYWRNFRPEIFSLPSPPEDHSSLADAMLEGYRNNDQLIGRFLADFPDDRLVFATALSQQPWDTTKCTYRPKDFDQLLGLIGIDMTSAEVAPLMAEEFLLSFPDEAAAQRAIAQLTECRVSDQPLFRMQEAEGPRFKAGCAINEWSQGRTMMTLPDGRQAPFDEYFYRIHSLRSGRHHPDGCFWVQSPTPRRVDERIPLTSVAPTILRLFGVNAPAYMKEAQVALTCYPN
ncbi:hypothetical protein FHT40_004866 [Mycolicibacterium sp. BK556]|uniref:alkaline phosphatase family protein n=1 Tax=unclassified Mycolicibacterium TaxID=2636767 RepID=UPI001619510F|nr:MULTISPECIES: alkaline phosphatase family protein [unclassified Mycolicibacterium]MBB3605182.1 hypothetical protein [Mycolicibacterium sp. BK556]MBB3635378.1 hypothetical protein [Mycolicibacterium sp. BK607]